MTPDVVLWIVVMGVLVAGTRLAVAQPASWPPRPPDEDSAPGPGWLAITATVVATVAVAALGLSVLVPALARATPYVALAAIAALTILFARSVAGSWPARAAVAVASATAGAAWALAASWLTYSLAAAFIAVALITVVRPRLSFWPAAAVMTVLAANDFIQVSVTHATVRAVAASDPYAGIAAHPSHAAGIPGLIGIPGHITLLTPYAVALGIGDVALPGILIVIAGRAGQLAGTRRLYAAAVTGYGAGLAACLAVAAATRAALPAMVFLIPGVVVAVAVAARQADAWPALAKAGRQADSAACG